MTDEDGMNEAMVKHNYSDVISGKCFSEAFTHTRSMTNGGMRLPHWHADVVIKAQYPDKNSKMTAPYLYVESPNGCVPWKMTEIELFSREWDLVMIRA